MSVYSNVSEIEHRATLSCRRIRTNTIFNCLRVDVGMTLSLLEAKTLVRVQGCRLRYCIFDATIPSEALKWRQVRPWPGLGVTIEHQSWDRKEDINGSTGTSDDSTHGTAYRASALQPALHGAADRG